MINTRDWWEKLFEHDWEHVGINGPAQTRYFMRMLIHHLRIVPAGNILDYGCALGQGVHELALAFPDCKVEGYDYAATAIRQARALYPQYTFHDKRPACLYDTVISSNVLEHYDNPVAQLQEQLKLSSRYFVLMTPYDEKIHNTHPARIDEYTFPAELDGFKKIYTEIIPPANVRLCYIAQILNIYERG